MKHRLIQFQTVVAVAGALLLSACAQTGYKGASVESAFASPNAIQVAPYTRTIFSSTNF